MEDLYTIHEKELMDLSDNYTILYGCLAHELISRFGEKGEKAVRKGTRSYGKDRGRATRKRHLDVNSKVNLEKLFTLYYDLPGDPRFKREKQELNPKERVSHTLVCPMSDTWNEYGQTREGRIYCEEFHPACYGEYAYGYTRVNLARTLTQKGDEYCSFNLILNPMDMPEEIRKKCFEEYDPDYVEPEFPDRTISGKEGFHRLTIKLYYHILRAALEELGEEAIETVEEGIRKYAKIAASLVVKTSEQYKTPVNEDLIDRLIPISLDYNNHEQKWKGYSDYRAREIWSDSFDLIFYHELSVLLQNRNDQ